MCTSNSNSNHIYKTMWSPSLGEELETQRELNNQKELDSDHDRVLSP